MLEILPALLLLVPSGRSFSEERLLLERRLETLRRILPDGPSETADIVHLRAMAQGAQLGRVEIDSRPPVEDATRGEAAYELSAVGGYDEIARFFGRVALSHRLIDVESVTLSSAPEQLIQLRSTLHLPFWPAGAPLPRPPQSSERRPSGVPRPSLEAFRRDQSLALAKSDAIATWRRARRNPRLFLSELAAVVQGRPVIIGYASLGESFTVRGLAVGEATVRGLESRFERGFFRVSEFLMAKQGACHRFEVHGTSPVVGPDAELPVAVDDPFLQDEAPCRVDRDPEDPIVVRGPTPDPKKPGNGLLTVRLRELDLADVFQVLGLVSGSAFLVDADAVGRVSLDAAQVTLEKTLSLLRSKARIAIGESGRVRRVSRAATSPGLGESAGGPAVSFALKRVDVRELLAVMTDIEPSLASLGPPGFLGRLSVWARGIPLFELRAEVLRAAGLVEHVQGGQRVLGRATGTAEPPVPVAGSGRDRRLQLQPEDLAVVEFELAGVASDGRSWTAFAYSPTGQLHAYRVGDRLSDGIVRSIESTDVVLETSEGPLRLALPAIDD